MLRSRPARAVAHPVTATVLVVAPLYPLYLTSLFGAVERGTALHTAVHLHVVLAGYLLAAVTIGVDAGHPAALRTRVTALVLAIAGHAVLAKLLYISATLPGYPASPDRVRAGAQVMYYGGDATELLLVAAVFAGWYARTGAGRRAPPRRPATGSGQRLAASDPKHLAGDVARLLRGEEDVRRGQLGGLRGAAHR
jgi:putative membrane protein